MIRRGWIVCGLLFVAGVLVWSAFPERQPAPDPGLSFVERAERPVTSGRSRESLRIAAEWRSLLAACEAGESPEALQRRLAAQKERWLEATPETVAAVIGQLLREGRDSPTGLTFDVGPGGALREWPTLRVFLLDLLAVTDPDTAVLIAREVLDTTGSPDEFAVALKPLLMGGPWKAGDDELHGYFSQLLGTPGWQSQPGFAEALDLSRLVPTPAVVAELARWIDGSPPLVAAGIMAAAESAAGSPAPWLELIVSDGTLLASRPELRASLMARADISDPHQSTAVEAYLQDPSIQLAEKQEFLRLFPLRGVTTGYRLYGSPPAPYSRSEVRRQDQASLERVIRWQGDPRYQAYAPDLGDLEGRLQGWLIQDAR